jgi:RND family efflux transporter MFP subunit
VIQAPFDGWVAQRAANLGDMVMPGTPLVTVYDPSALRAVANVPQYRITQLKQVKLAKIEVSDVLNSTRWIESTSVTVVPAADAATHSTQVRVSLPTGQKDLVPGTYARVHFVVGSVDKLTVPAKAVVRRGEVAAVYVQSPQGKLSLRQLRLGEKLVDGNADAYEVLAGLVDGEQVVTDPVQAAMSLKSTAAK